MGNRVHRVLGGSSQRRRMMTLRERVPCVDHLILRRVSWQAFGSCTFRKERNFHRSLGLFLRVLRRAEALWQPGCEGFAIWLLRFERGEVAGREHFHFLVGGFPSRNMGGSEMNFFCVSGCLWWVHEWSCLIRGGWARVRPYTEKTPNLAQSCRPVNYILKGLENRHEGDKFNQIHFSPSLVHVLRDTKSSGEGRAPRFKPSDSDETDVQGQTDFAWSGSGAEVA